MRCTEELKRCTSPLHKRIYRTGGYTESIAKARNVSTICCGAGQQIPAVSPLCPSPPRGDGSAQDQFWVLLSPSLLVSPFSQLSHGLCQHSELFSAWTII